MVQGTKHILCRKCWLENSCNPAEIDLPEPYMNFHLRGWELVKADDIADAKHPGPYFWLCPMHTAGYKYTL